MNEPLLSAACSNEITQAAETQNSNDLEPLLLVLRGGSYNRSTSGFGTACSKIKRDQKKFKKCQHQCKIRLVSRALQGLWPRQRRRYQRRGQEPVAEDRTSAAAQTDSPLL